jgi:hypothetical protein
MTPPARTSREVIVSRRRRLGSGCNNRRCTTKVRLRKYASSYIHANL